MVSRKHPRKEVVVEGQWLKAKKYCASDTPKKTKRNMDENEILQLSDLVTLVCYQRLFQFNPYESFFSQELSSLSPFTNTTTISDIMNPSSSYPGNASPPPSPNPSMDSNIDSQTLAYHQANSHLFRAFCQKTIQSLNVSIPIVIVSLKLLDRLMLLNHSINASVGSEFRIWAVALLLSNKCLNDHRVTNKSFSESTCIDLEEINIMEKEFLNMIKYQLHISIYEYEQWTKQLQSVSNFLWSVMHRTVHQQRLTQQHHRQQQQQILTSHFAVNPSNATTIMPVTPFSTTFTHTQQLQPQPQPQVIPDPLFQPSEVSSSSSHSSQYPSPCGMYNFWIAGV